MGVSGSGKTTVGRSLAERLGAAFIEGDDFHPPANRTKMAGGVALTDEDRWPWLTAIGAAMAEARQRGAVIAACSALKRRYRNHLVVTSGLPLAFICLHGRTELLAKRLAERRGHFMPSNLLDSQIATLELPEDDERAVTLDIADPVPKLVAQAALFLAP